MVKVEFVRWGIISVAHSFQAEGEALLVTDKSSYVVLERSFGRATEMRT